MCSADTILAFNVAPVSEREEEGGFASEMGKCESKCKRRQPGVTY